MACVHPIIALLDRIDPDPDLELEPDLEPVVDKEPSLGSLDHHVDQENWSRWSWASPYDIDREDEHDGREPDEDTERRLGQL